jgi:hypothetical protein
VPVEDRLELDGVDDLALHQHGGDLLQGGAAAGEEARVAARDSSRMRRTSRSISRAVCSLQEESLAPPPGRNGAAAPRSGS